jgi:dUTP pyrophosphatase
MLLKVKKLDLSARLPLRAHPGDAGVDLYALERTIVGPGQRTAVKTGISVEIPEGYVGLVWDKSGLAIKNGLKTLGGVIDAGYRGEILIGMINLGTTEYIFEAGHKVAQLLIQKIELCDVKEVKELPDTIRGEAGFGSTGK